MIVVRLCENGCGRVAGEEALGLCRVCAAALMSDAGYLAEEELAKLGEDLGLLPEARRAESDPPAYRGALD